MTKILFTGITGLLGGYFLKTKPESFEVIGTYNTNAPVVKDFLQLNIGNRKEVLSLITRIKPQIIVHAASIGSVDYCETHKEEAHKINVEGTRNVIDACFEIGTKIIFTSSNAVYDGNNPPYNEKSKTNPLDVYGRTKVEGEELIRKSSSPHIILRLMTMYGWQQKGGRENPVTWVIKQLKDRKPINVVNDIFNNHLYAGQAAQILWKIIEADKNKEVYNIAGGECISRYDLALKVSQVFNLDSSMISSVPNSFFKNIAPRPKNTCFDTKKIGENFDIRPLTILDGLEIMKGEKSAS